MNEDLFAPILLNKVRLRNRFILAAASTGVAADASGHMSGEEIDRLTAYAGNGVGLIITGAIGISASALSHAGSLSLAKDSSIPGFSRLTKAVHEQGGRIAAQLCHSGIWTGAHMAEQNREAIAPSRIRESPYGRRPGLTDNYHAASREEIYEVIASFADAAARAEASGFDAVEVHGAHDSLLAQFLSPVTNDRTDAWGGSLENRARIHCEIGQTIRRRVGANYPVILKIGVEDGIPGGLEFAEGREAARLCGRSGFDVLEISQGLQGTKFSEMALRSPIADIGQEGFSRDWCRQIKNAGATTIMTGGLRSFELVEEIVTKGETDFIGLCRPLIREPDLIRRWQNGDHAKSTCISCNRCAIAVSKGMALECYAEK